MGSLTQVQAEITELGRSHDIIRRRHLDSVCALTNRNAIVYYSGWMEKGSLIRQGFDGFGIIDSDKNGLMAAIHGLDRSRGLDLILHTPGGDVAATESIIDYLRAMFGSDIRAIVPHLAMSGGTMIALASNEIIMGKHSALGPIDPQFDQISAHAILAEFDMAKADVASNPAFQAVWRPILEKYPPTIIVECGNAIQWAEAIARQSLATGMFASHGSQAQAIDAVLAELASHSQTLSHARHLPIERIRALGLTVTSLEDDQALQDAVLSLHHACILTLGETNAAKIIESTENSFITRVEVVR